MANKETMWLKNVQKLLDNEDMDEKPISEDKTKDGTKLDLHRSSSMFHWILYNFKHDFPYRID